MGTGILGQLARALTENFGGGQQPGDIVEPQPDFSGRWFTTFGPMTLTQEGARVHGHYCYQGVQCTIEGNLDNGKLIFEYHEPTISGEGWFGMVSPGKFAGQWRPHGMEVFARWEGLREFEGIWETSFGPMRLLQTHDGIHGFYDGLGAATLQGTIQEGRLVFRYQEPKAQGEGWFELAEDGETFEGQWKEEGEKPWAPWFGRRVHAKPGLIWLVVMEAHWQRSLKDKEYSFGNMLREFFARLPQVEVRQRFFDSEAGLERWCRELMYLPEPSVVVIATHGNEEGLQALGKTVDPRIILNGLRYADNIQALHFSSCLMLKDGQTNDLARAMQRACPFPVSGYNTSVDWAASALIEFHYLDMILGRNLSPADAADQVTKMLAYAGDQGDPRSPYPSAGFRFFPPGNLSKP